MHHAEGDTVPVEDGLERAADGALLAPDFHAAWLIAPSVAPISSAHAEGVTGCVGPLGDLLDFAGFIDDPVPGNDSLLAGVGELNADPTGLRLRHVRGDVQHKQAVTDGADAGGLDF